MRHRVSSHTFGRRSGPRKALMRGLASNLIDAERISTTVAKAKELRKYLEPLITMAKRGDLHARRLVTGQLYRKQTVQKLFDDLAVRFKDRPGGYTRIFKANNRQGDGAPLAIIEFMDRPAQQKSDKKATKKKDETKPEKTETVKVKAESKEKFAKKTATKATKKTTTKKVTKKSTSDK